MQSHYMVRTKKKTLAVTHQSPRSLIKYEIIWTCDRRQGHLQRSHTTPAILHAASGAIRHAAVVIRVIGALHETGWLS